MKTQLLGLGIATLLATAVLPGCGVMIDDVSPVAVGGQGAVVASSSTTVISNDHGSRWHHRWDDDGNDDGSYDTTVDDTTVITTTTPVVVAPAPVYGPPAPAPQDTGLDPVIQAFTANPSNNVTPGQPITFTVVANDPGHDPLQFNWSATGGLLSTNTGRVVTWTPPSTPGTYTVSTIITNGRGGAVTGSQNLMVMADGHATLTAQAAPAAASAPVAAAPATTTVATNTATATK